MSFSRKIIILDCGASRVSLGIFSQHRGRLRLDRHLVETFPAPVGHGEEWVELTQVAFRSLRSQLGRGGPCLLVLPGHAVLTKFIKVPRVKPEQREKVIHFESGQNLPIALSELVWDSVIAAEQESGLEVMLAASHLKKVAPLCAAARAAGFEPRRVLPAPLATLAAFRMVHDQPAQPSVVMSLGARSTTFLFVEAGRFLVRTFAFGVARPSAGAPACDAVSVANRLAQEFTRSILFFRRQSGLTDPAQVYLTGGGAQLAGLPEALTDRLKLPVDRLDLSNTLEVGRDVGVETNPPPVLTDLAGAAVTQMRDGHSVVNLLPPRQQRRVERHRRHALAVAALLLVALPGSAILLFRPASRRDVRTTPATEQHAPPPVGYQEPSPTAVADVAPGAPPKEEPVNAPAFGVELLGVKTEPYRLELAGYLGGLDDYLAVFVSPGRPGTMVARVGARFEELGIELRKFEVKRLPMADAEGPSAYELVAMATLHDETTGGEVVLDTRNPTFARPRAMLRWSEAGDPARAVGEGEEIAEEAATYRIDRIQVAPPEVVVARHVRGSAATDIQVLHPVRGKNGAIEAASAVRPATGVASSAR